MKTLSRVGDLELDAAADEAQAGVADQRARQQAGLGQDLEAVADAQHGHAPLGAAHHLAHHRAARRHGAAAQIVAVGEAAGHADQVERRQLGLLVPDPQHRPRRNGLHRDGEVAVAVGAGEGDDRGAHQADPRLNSLGKADPVGLDHGVGEQLARTWP